MEIKNIKDCFDLRLLRRIAPDKEKSKRSMEIARNRLQKAEKAMRLKIFEYVILESYMAMFHAARALLYRDGVQEKSHYAMYLYLKEKYADRIPSPVITLLDIHRTERHDAMYGLDYSPEQNDAKIAIEDAKEFLKAIRGGPLITSCTPRKAQPVSLRSMPG
ncbi:HEPN domain-containing protein [Candidatus Woesearchaeota archaeon]|nr:HEPN domain-containing protein [Candidatus Woesearchaeota archaeon]